MTCVAGPFWPVFANVLAECWNALRYGVAIKRQLMSLGGLSPLGLLPSLKCVGIYAIDKLQQLPVLLIVELRLELFFVNCMHCVPLTLVEIFRLWIPWFVQLLPLKCAFMREIKFGLNQMGYACTLGYASFELSPNCSRGYVHGPGFAQ